MSKIDIDALLNGYDANMSLPDPTLVLYYSQLQDRVIYMDSEIDDDTMSIVQQILLWNKEDKGIPIEERKPIKIFFHSYGGSLSVYQSIVDAITLSKTPVWGINIGVCMSAAAFIYLSCHKRFAFKTSTFLFHQGSGAFSGNYNEIVCQLIDYQKSVDRLVDVMKQYTTYTEDEIKENIVDEWYVYPEEALEKGVCDEIVSDIDILI